MRASQAEAYRQALACHQSGRLAEAEQRYRAILAEDGQHADSLHLLGVLAQQTQRPLLAQEMIEKAIAIQGDVAVYHANLGTVYQGLGRLDDAVSACRQALHLKPDDAAMHYNLGNTLRDSGYPTAALGYFRRALCCHPGFAEAFSNLGIVMRGARRTDAALSAYRRALQLKPDLAQTHAYRGAALQDEGRLDAAITAFRCALCLKPEEDEALANIGKALHKAGRLAEAETVFRRVQVLTPDAVENYYNLGTALKSQGKFMAELDCYAEALRRHPNDANTHFNIALTRLLLGDFAEGWQHYAWRWQSTVRPRGLTPPLWDGGPLVGRTILLHAEQGLGDTLQFCRYVLPVRARGAKVVLEVQTPLLALLAGMMGEGVQVVARGEPLPPFDLHCPLLDLPRHFDTGLDNIPACLPASPPDGSRVAAWRKRLPKTGFRIGIAWQGNPDHKADDQRSVRLRDFLPIAKIPGVCLISLQKLHGLDQLDRVPDGMAVTTLGPGYDAGDFVETAAVMAGLDLVVTVDSAVAHLAGTLGCPVWVLLPTVPDWRWMLAREDSPWYPSMRLFRQTTRGDWADVFERVARHIL